MVTGKYINANLYLDYSNWELKSEAVIAEISTLSYVDYGKTRNGVIGMGFDGDSINSFKSPLFSVYLNKDLSGGKLMFFENMVYTNSSTRVAVINTDKNWVAELYYGPYVDIKGKLVLDMNADAIGIPEVYSSLTLFKSLFLCKMYPIC